MTPAREFKAAVRAAVLALPGAPEGFGFDDLAGRLGDAYKHDGRERTRLWRWVTNHKGGDLLSLARGRYAAGPDLKADEALGVGVQLVDDIRQAFDDAGGVLSFHDLLVEVGREGDGTLVRRILTESSLYESGSPFAGYRQAWFLIDGERLKLPVPGRLLAFDLQTAAGGPRLDLPRLLRRRREQVAAGLAEAREFAAMSAVEIVAVPAVANALDAALRTCGAIRYREDGEPETCAEWWASARAAGRPAALADAWASMEQADPVLLGATTVRFWRAAGKALGFDPPLLSRGSVARRQDC